MLHLSNHVAERRAAKRETKGCLLTDFICSVMIQKLSSAFLLPEPRKPAALLQSWKASHPLTMSKVPSRVVETDVKHLVSAGKLYSIGNQGRGADR